jgi:DNA-binding LacI/PurR family transcriptional regulator
VPTIHDVARLAEVSIKTVSNVLNDYPHIRPATKQRVLDAIATLDYTPNLTARGLRSGRTGLVSLIIPDLRNAYFAELADIVVRAAEAQGLSVLIAQSNGDRERELSLLSGPRMQMVDGILFSALGLSAADNDLLARIKTPMVLLGERILDGPKDHVTMRNVEGSQAATEHLLSIGRRRLVAFGADPEQGTGSAHLRLDGYRRALTAAGIPEDPDLVVRVDETRYTLPTLSTIDPGREEIVEVALRWLTERIDGSAADLPPRDHLTAFRVLQRESTTPA